MIPLRIDHLTCVSIRFHILSLDFNFYSMPMNELGYIKSI